MRRLLEHALALREAHQAGALDAATLAAEPSAWAPGSTSWWVGRPATRPTAGSSDHLGREREHLCTCLRLPGVEATNWRAEQAIRPAVVTRKVWGGNRTWAGADTWQVLASVLRTASQQDRDPVDLLARLLGAPDPIVANLAIPGR